MTRGLGERQRKDRLLTTSKIASYLAVRPFTYQELQRESKIQRKRLRDGLDELVMRKIVIRHKFSINDPNLERNSIYYLLSWSKTGSKQLVKYYYNNSSTNNKDAMLNNKDEKPVHNGIDQLNAVAKKVEELTMSDEEWRQFCSLLRQGIRKCELRGVKEQIKLNDDEPSELDIRFTLKAVNYFALSKGYSFLDVLVKLSADEKIEGIGIYTFTTLWEIMEKTGLLDKYKNEIH